MLSILARLFLTGTAVAPVLSVYAVMAFFEGEIYSAITISVVVVLSFFACIGMLHYVKKKLEKLSFSTKTVESADKDSIGIMLLYVLPLLNLSFSELSWQTLIPAIVIFLALVVTGSSYHFNPLLNIMCWRFYKVSTEEGVTYILITKREFHSAPKTITVVQLTRYTVIDIGEH